MTCSGVSFMYVCYINTYIIRRSRPFFNSFVLASICTRGQPMLPFPHFWPNDASKANFGINAGRGLKDSPEPRGQTMLQNMASGCFKSQDREGFSEGHAEDFGALGLRAAVAIWSGRPKPACRRNIPRRSAAGRGNSTRSGAETVSARKEICTAAIVEPLVTRTVYEMRTRMGTASKSHREATFTDGRWGPNGMRRNANGLSRNPGWRGQEAERQMNAGRGPAAPSGR